MRRNREARAGFTMAEALIVIGIVVVLAAAAVPSGMGAWNNVRQIQLNRSAETIYMTAQRNLIAAKVSDTTPQQNKATSNPYKATSNPYDASTNPDKDTMLPANTISPALYAGNWVILYDKNNWTVTTVYYSETESITSLTDDELTAWKTGQTGKVGWYGA